ncbi:MAG: ROK family protein [Vicinamibacterales bacterium]|jgi:predicted NBD/HSP70 family sugar kinase|nr:ROK family protein [Vicinamibacterales bacterium]
MPARLKVLVIDVGGTNVKVSVTGQQESRKFASSARLTPRKMVAGVKAITKDWKYDAVSIGYPGVVRNGRIAVEPFNLGRGWVGFSFRKAFRRPVRIVNDAVMQALGSYRGGTMLFLGLGTGLGTALVVNGHLVPMELGHFPYRKMTIEDYLGTRGFETLGRARWRKVVGDVVKEFVAAFLVDDVVLGGGNVKKLTRLPKGCRAGANTNAFLGGFRLWEQGKP